MTVKTMIRRPTDASPPRFVFIPHEHKSKLKSCLLKSWGSNWSLCGAERTTDSLIKSFNHSIARPIGKVFREMTSARKKLGVKLSHFSHSRRVLVEKVTTRRLLGRVGGGASFLFQHPEFTELAPSHVRWECFRVSLMYSISLLEN